MRVLLLVVLLAASGLAQLPVADAQDPGQIRIQGDGGFLGRPGGGTSANPWRIENLSLTAGSGNAIEIKDTRNHVRIANVVILGSGAEGFDGIRLLNATNVTIDHVDIQFARTGIHLQQADGTKINATTVRAGKTGILLEGTTRAEINNSRIAVNAEDIAFRSFQPPRGNTQHSVGNLLRDNHLSIATDQIGLSFSGPQVYDNDIDDSNDVNFVPVRWYTHLRGNDSQPAIASGSAHVKGITNVGQIVCYNCSHVRFDQTNATSGSASGLVIEQGRNISIARAFAQGNAVAGIALRNSTNVTVDGASLYANGLPGHPEGAGLRAANVSVLTITGATVVGNQNGIVVSGAPSPLIERSSIEENAVDGIVLDGTRYARTLSNRVMFNGGDGIRISLTSDTTTRDETVARNRGAGITLANVMSAKVHDSRVDGNGRGGIVLGARTLLADVRGNTLSNNADAGILFNDTSTLNQIASNDLSSHARHIRFTNRSEQNTLTSNTMTSAPGEVGLWFDKEDSYNNNVGTTNLVGGTPVQWHVALVGRPDAPIVLQGLRVETPNVTNVAQIMIYKGSYVDVLDPVASHGTRGVYALRSSSLKIEGAILEDTQIGVDLQGTQTATVRYVLAVGARTAVHLTATQNVSVSDVSANATAVAVQFSDASSRGSVVQRIDASGATQASILDPTASTSSPQHLIADAGRDKLAGAGRNVSFSDAIGVARFGSERLVRQTWTFGDGTEESRTGEDPLRPVHAYDSPGMYIVTYSLETADGLRLTDTAQVRVVPPPEAPPEVHAAIKPSKDGVTLDWAPPSSEFPITGYTVYRGLDPNNLVKMLDTVNNATTVSEKFDASMHVYYAITASTGVAGEGALSTPFELVYDAPPPPTPTPPTQPTGPAATTPSGEEVPVDGLGTPAPAWVAVLALAGVALLARRRH